MKIYTKRWYLEVTHKELLVLAALITALLSNL